MTAQVKLKLLLLVTLLGHTSRIIAQQDKIDSLEHILENAPDDITSINVLNALSFQYHSISPEKSMELAEEAIVLAESIGYQKGLGDAYSNIGVCLAITGKPEKAIRSFLDALTIREKTGDVEGVAKVLNNIAGLYTLQEDFETALSYTKQSLQKLDDKRYPDATGNAHISLGLIHGRKGDIKKSIEEFEEAIRIFEKNRSNQRLSDALLQLGGVLADNKQYDRALLTYRQAFGLLRNQPAAHQHIDLHIAISNVARATGKTDSAYYHLHTALNMARERNNRDAIRSCTETLSIWHKEAHRFDSALHYSRLFQKQLRETFNRERNAQIASLEKIFHAEKKEKELEKIAGKIRSQQNLLTITGLLLVIAVSAGFILFQYSRSKKKANERLRAMNLSISEKNEEIQLQADRISELNKSLEEEVMKRTTRIREQNRTLIEYAYFNSHELRAPLASILGLVTLIKMEGTEAFREEILIKLGESANRLDDVVKSMTRRLDSET